MLNSRNFDSEKYESCLSSFGTKVLRNLLKITEGRGNENNRIINRNRYSFQNKRVLTFEDTHTSSSLNLSQFHNKTLRNTHQPISGLQDHSKIITSSDELLNHVYKNKDNAENNLTQNDALSYQDNHVTSGIVRDISNKQVAHNLIEWADIIDTQLLNDLNILDSNNNQTTVMEISSAGTALGAKYDNNKICEEANVEIRKNVNMLNTINPLNPVNIESVNFMNSPKSIIKQSGIAEKIPDKEKHTSHSKNSEAMDTDICIDNGNDIVSKGKSKRKNLTKITNVIPKKVKKAQGDLPKNTFRKQTYTKVVKNWLDSVNHQKFDDVIGEQNTTTNEDAKTNTMLLESQSFIEAKKVKTNLINQVKSTLQDEVEPQTSKSKKIKPNYQAKPKTKDIKTVQAQLTNKGGIMKFGKPKKSDVTDKHTDVDTSTKNNSINIDKEKKGKPKFIPPLKSQIPVREIVYTITNINNDNSEQYMTKLSAVKDSEIEMILLFSNGFSQLNSHYTEDTCIVVGVMFRIDSLIYYWKGVYKSFCKTLWNIIIHNTIICHDGKNLIKYFISQHDMDVSNRKIDILDTQIGGCLIDPDNSPENFTDLQKLLSYTPEYTIATECSFQKSAWYLTLLGDCSSRLRAALIDQELWKVFVEIEMPVLPIVAEMELRGVRVDLDRLKRMEGTLLGRMRRAELACHRAAGRAFQPLSAPQVRALLYEELELDAQCNVTIRETLCKGEKSTSESMLRSLMSVHPLPKLILEYRHLHKAHATFLAGIANQVKDGVVKATWVQTAAATGRIASNNPNLQAIPKTPFSLELFPNTDAEKSAEDNELLNFRSVYVPREGHELLAADFKHIECRVFAFAAADTGLLRALASPDLFRVLAAKWLNKSEEAVCAEDRERTKRIVYASLYGAGCRRLMGILDLSYDQTLSVMASFNRTFPALKRFGRAVVEACAARGGRLATLCGRARSLSDITSADPAARAHAERQAVNFVVQGSAADLCKLAMAECARRLRAAGLGAHLLLQIHDELVWEVAGGELDRAAAIVKQAMEGVGASRGVAVPLPVALARGGSWGDMRPYAPSPPGPQAPSTLTEHLQGPGTLTLHPQDPSTLTDEHGDAGITH